MRFRVVPFFQFDFMAFRRYGAQQFGRSLGAGCSIAEGNRHFTSATTAARCIVTPLTIDNNTALLQTHAFILLRFKYLPMPARSELTRFAKIRAGNLRWQGRAPSTYSYLAILSLMNLVARINAS